MYSKASTNQSSEKYEVALKCLKNIHIVISATFRGLDTMCRQAFKNNCNKFSQPDIFTQSKGPLNIFCIAMGLYCVIVGLKGPLTLKKTCQKGLWKFG